jgi:hypothetical protein
VAAADRAAACGIVATFIVNHLSGELVDGTRHHRQASRGQTRFFRLKGRAIGGACTIERAYFLFVPSTSPPPNSAASTSWSAAPWLAVTRDISILEIRQSPVTSGHSRIGISE